MFKPNGYTKGNIRGLQKQNNKKIAIIVLATFAFFLILYAIIQKPNGKYSWESSTVYFMGNRTRNGTKMLGNLTDEELDQNDCQTVLTKFDVIDMKKGRKVNWRNAKYQYYLTVGAISRGDQHVLREWVKHYLSEGVEHFYLADNVTDDNKAYIYAVYDFVKKGIISFYRKVGEFTQYEYYNHFVLPEAQRTSKWLLIVDTDEFVFAPQPDMTLVKNLKYFDEQNEGVVTQICAPWVWFASNNVYEQPLCVTQAYRKGQMNPNNFGKCFVKPQAIYQLAIHAHILMEGITACSNGVIQTHYKMEDICNGGGCGLPKQQDVCWVRAKNVMDYIAIVNHYQLQSLEYYERVRLVRRSRMSEMSQSFWTADRWKNLNNSIGTEQWDLLPNKRTVDFCKDIKDEDNYIGMDKVLESTRNATQEYWPEIDVFEWRSQYINSQMSDYYYNLPNVTNITYINSQQFTRLSKYNYQMHANGEPGNEHNLVKG